jgi:hypothetical protein
MDMLVAANREIEIQRLRPFLRGGVVNFEKHIPDALCFTEDGVRSKLHAMESCYDKQPYSTQRFTNVNTGDTANTPQLLT